MPPVASMDAPDQRHGEHLPGAGTREGRREPAGAACSPMCVSRPAANPGAAGTPRRRPARSWSLDGSSGSAAHGPSPRRRRTQAGQRWSRRGGARAVRGSVHRRERRHPAERVPRPPPPEGEGAEQLAVDVDGGPADPGGHPRAREAASSRRTRTAAAVGAGCVEHAHHDHWDLAPLPAGPLGDAHASCGVNDAGSSQENAAERASGRSTEPSN